MKSLPTALLNHLLGDATTLATCWLIEAADGTMIRGTDHDTDITVDSVPTGIDENLIGTYVAAANIAGSDMQTSTDMSVDNMEISGGFQVDFAIPDITVAQIESGVLDSAPVTVIALNWASPNDGLVYRRAYLGQPTRTSSGGYRYEVRGLAQALTQNIGTTYGDRCDVKRFGDARCGLDLAPLTRTGTVTAVTSRRAFSASLSPSTDPPTATYFSAGLLEFTSGDNDNFKREVKRAPVTAGVAAIELWDEMPADVQVGDTLTLEPGCDRRYETCRDVFDNLDNFRGYGVFIPGVDALTKGPA